MSIMSSAQQKNNYQVRNADRKRDEKPERNKRETRAGAPARANTHRMNAIADCISYAARLHNK